MMVGTRSDLPASPWLRHATQVQDTLDPEFYAGAVKVGDAWHTSKYR